MHDTAVAAAPSGSAARSGGGGSNRLPQHSAGPHLQELVKVNGAGAVLVDVGNHLQQRRAVRGRRRLISRAGQGRQAWSV